MNNWISPTDQMQWNPASFSDAGNIDAGPAYDTSFDRVVNQPGFLATLGLGDIENPWIGDSGDSGGTFSLDPRITEALQNGNYEMRAFPVNGGVFYSPFQNNREVGNNFRQFQPNYEGRGWDIAEGLLASAIMPGGWVGGTQSGIGGAVGLTGNAAAGANAAFNVGIISGGSGGSTKDIGRAMLTAGGSSFLPNMGEYVGIDNPYLQRSFNGAVIGAGNAELRGGDATTGAITGGLPGLAEYAGGRFMDTSYVPTLSGQNLINETNQMSMLPRGGLSSFVDQPQMSSLPSYVPQGSPMAFNQPRKQRSGFELTDLTDFFGKLVPNSPEQWGSFAEGLGGMLLGGMQYRKARELEKQFGGRRGAYEANLRRNLERRDAATGRRSNYSGRETQLQAALAELDSRNLPGLTSLNNAQFAGLSDIFRSGLRYAGKQGMFGERYTPGYREQSSMSPSSDLMSPSSYLMSPSSYLMSLGAPLPDVSAPITDWANDPTQKRSFKLGGMK